MQLCAGQARVPATVWLWLAAVSTLLYLYKVTGVRHINVPDLFWKQSSQWKQRTVRLLYVPHICLQLFRKTDGELLIIWECQLQFMVNLKESYEGFVEREIKKIKAHCEEVDGLHVFGKQVRSHIVWNCSLSKAACEQSAHIMFPVVNAEPLPVPALISMDPQRYPWGVERQSLPCAAS